MIMSASALGFAEGDNIPVVLSDGSKVVSSEVYMIKESTVLVRHEKFEWIDLKSKRLNPVWLIIFHLCFASMFWYFGTRNITSFSLFCISTVLI